MWDAIAREVYGSEKYMHLLLDANPAHRETVLFSAGVTLSAPENTSDIGISETLPPWKR